MKISLYSDLRNYSFGKFAWDLIAGLTIAVILIPQGMAYSLLAGLEPIYGLYAALVPLLVYPFFAASRYLTLGPVALMCIIILGGVSALAEPGSEEYLNLVILSSFLAGLMQVVFSFLKIGNLTSFLSRPVMTGFISAAGIIITISQLKYLLTLDLPRRISTLHMVVDLFKGIGQLNWISLSLGLAALFIIVLLKKVHRAIPGALLVVVIGSVLVMSFRLMDRGVPVMGDIPAGLPPFSLSFLSFNDVVSLLPLSLIIALVGYIGSYSITKSLGSVKEQNSVNPNKELFALGLAKIVGSFFLAMPSTGSFTRSAVNYEVGAKTQISNIVAGLTLVFTLLFLGGLFYYLPEPVLAAIVISSVFSLINIKQAKKLFLSDKRDFVVFMITFLSTLLFGITNGIIVGVLASFCDIMYRTSKPYYAILGRLKNTSVYRNIRRYPDAISLPNILIFRFSQSLYFANARMIIDAIEKERISFPDTKYIIISFPTHAIPDYSATSYFFRVMKYCNLNNIRLVYTDLTGPVRDHLKKVGFSDQLGSENFYLTVEDAVNAIEKGDVIQPRIKNYSSQTNLNLDKPIVPANFWD